ncbi:MAG: sigma-70 family RNA polymerase sigma factor [Planctomycetia bacterium]|nr:sigma-70 family RNA polymerase sigma factor [Planctomycetia bacterium]
MGGPGDHERTSFVADARCDVAAALVAWQTTGDDRSLERVIGLAAADLERVAVRALHRLHVRDRAAVDDTLSLVFDHVRRLAAGPGGERPVAPFNPAGRPLRGRGDPGRAYLAWLTEERARDVARSRRRQTRRACCFSELGRVPHDRDRTGRILSRTDVAPDDDCPARLHAAVVRLEPRLRTVVELLLEGKSQAVIAHALDVCEGTVSRLRARALEELRRALGA